VLNELPMDLSTWLLVSLQPVVSVTLYRAVHLSVDKAAELEVQ
jgi:hypothetical protein